MATPYVRTTGSLADSLAAEAVRVSKDFIHHLYGHDFDWCLHKTSKDFLWMGTREEHFAASRDVFAHYLESGDAPQKATVADEEYAVVACTERMCCVTGRYLVLFPPDNDKISAMVNRCTMVWHRVGKRVQLVHLHVSAPASHAEEGETHHVAAGTDTYRYMQSLRRLGSSRKSVSLYDVDGTVHWVHPSQIIYLEASRKRTIVHCMTKDIVVPAVIRDTVDMVGNKVMRVHRSYAVNRDHVVELKAGRLLLDDGTSIVIPAKRIADVRAELTGN